MKNTMSKPFLLIFLGIVLVAFSAIADEAPGLAWGVQFGTSGDDFPREVEVDIHGNVYVVGETNGDLGGENAGSDDGFLVKYNVSGTQEWALQFGTSMSDGMSGVTVVSDTGAIVVGKTNGTLGDEKFGSSEVVVAYIDEFGNTVWIKQFGSSKADIGNRVVVDQNANSYITGKTLGVLGEDNTGGYDVFVAKFDNQGNQQWITQFGTSSSDEGRDLALDSNGNIYVCGTTSGSFDIDNLGDQDAFVTKIDTAGQVVWTRQYGTSSKDNGHGIAVGSQGDIYAGGWTYGVMGDRQYSGGDPYLTLFDSDGNRSWTQQFGTWNWDGIHGMAAFDDESGDVLIGGCWNWPSCHGWLRRYDHEGNLLWEKLIYNTASKSSCGQTVAIDVEGNCYHVGGTDDDLFQENSGYQDVFLVKLSESTDVGKSSNRYLPEDFTLYHNVPNPFNPTTEIRYTLNKDSYIRLTLINIQGQVIKTLVDGWQTAADHSVRWNARDDADRLVSSGVYFYRLISENQIEIQKMLLIR